jgi:hypothetical protein
MNSPYPEGIEAVMAKHRAACLREYKATILGIDEDEFASRVADSFRKKWQAGKFPLTSADDAAASAAAGSADTCSADDVAENMQALRERCRLQMLEEMGAVQAPPVGAPARAGRFGNERDLAEAGKLMADILQREKEEQAARAQRKIANQQKLDAAIKLTAKQFSVSYAKGWEMVRKNPAHAALCRNYAMGC